MYLILLQILFPFDPSMSHVVYEARHAFPEATIYPRSQEHSYDDYPDAYSVRGRIIPQSAPYRVEGGQPAVRFWTQYQSDSLPKMGLNLGEALVYRDMSWLLNNRHPVRFYEPKIRIFVSLIVMLRSLIC